MSILDQIHSDMTLLVPGIGGRATPVSVSYRLFGSKSRWVMIVTLSKQVATDMRFRTGAKQECWAEMGFDEKTGTLVLVNVTNIDTPAHTRWKGNARNGTLVFTLTARWLGDHRTKHAAERCEHKIMDHHDATTGLMVKFIEITVPDWAAPMRKGMKAAAGAADAARARLGLAAVPHVRPGPR